MLIEIYDNGEMHEITNHETTLKEDSVYLLLSYRNKRTYIWAGKDANVRKRFIAAKEARRIKMETGFQTFNVQHDDMFADFDEDFNAYMNDLKAHIGLPSVLQEQRERIRKEYSSLEPSYAPPAQKKPKKESQKKVDVMKTAKSIAEEFSKLEKPKGMVRDYIIIGDKVYSILEDKKSLSLSPVTDLPDGFFDANGYEPRILIENAKIKGIELWRKR